MNIALLLLSFLGGGVCLAGWLWLVVLAFRQSALRGILVAIIPISAVRFIINQWATAWRPAAVWAVGLALWGMGTAVASLGYSEPSAAKSERQAGIEANVAAGDGRAAIAAASVNGGAMSFFLSPGRTMLRVVIGLVSHPHAEPPRPAAPAPSLQERLIALRVKEAALREKKAKLDPKDRPSALALTAEINGYNAELQPLLAELREHPEAAQ